MTALTDPGAVEFEVVDETPGSGLELADAYALLAGLIDPSYARDAGLLTRRQRLLVAAASWNENEHPRDTRDGRFVTDAVDAVPASNDISSQTLSSTERSAVSTYQTGAYRRINDALRGSKGRIRKIMGAPDAHATRFDSTENLRRAAETLDAIHQRSRTTRDTTVFRGVADLRAVFGRRANGDLTGTSWTEHGFSSTTPNEQNALQYMRENSGALLNVNVPAGTGAVTLTSTNQDGPKKFEVVLQRGLRYRVTRDRVVNGIRQLDVEVTRG